MIWNKILRMILPETCQILTLMSLFSASFSTPWPHRVYCWSNGISYDLFIFFVLQQKVEISTDSLSVLSPIAQVSFSLLLYLLVPCPLGCCFSLGSVFYSAVRSFLGILRQVKRPVKIFVFSHLNVSRSLFCFYGTFATLYGMIKISMMALVYILEISVIGLETVGIAVYFLPFILTILPD